MIISHITCTIDGCNNQHLAKGLCNKHYLRVKYGNSTQLRGYAKTHGQRKHPLYHRWNDIKQRCLNPKDSSYARYGGRGITIHERWLGADGFENFLEDMGQMPEQNMSIDRINNDGNYSPDNCRWADSSTQMLNRRTPKNNKSGVKGVGFIVKSGRWYACLKINGKAYFRYTASKEQAANERRKLEQEYL